MCGNNPPTVHDIQAIQRATGGMKIYLMTLHAITGCATTLALFWPKKEEGLSDCS